MQIIRLIQQLFINDYIGIQMKLPKEYEIYKYEDLNASTMPADKTLSCMQLWAIQK